MSERFETMVISNRGGDRLAEDLDPCEADAILRYLAGNRRPKFKRGQRADHELPVVPELLDEMESLMLQARPCASFSKLKSLARDWESAGFTAQQAQQWLGNGARPEDVRHAMAFKDAGLGAAAAFAHPRRHGLLLTQTFFDLVRDRELTAMDVRRVLDKAQAAREERESS
jgi:hypothetical protein